MKPYKSTPIPTEIKRTLQNVHRKKRIESHTYLGPDVRHDAWVYEGPSGGRLTGYRSNSDPEESGESGEKGRNLNKASPSRYRVEMGGVEEGMMISWGKTMEVREGRVWMGLGHVCGCARRIRKGADCC
jgi:hypothetical protein